MRYSTANHNPRQPGSVNSRLDFDAAKAAAAFTASQAQTTHAHGAPAARGAVEPLTACKVSEVVRDLETTIKCDPDLARLSVGLRQAAQLRLWLPITQHARETGYNHLRRDQLRALLARYQIRYSERNLSRWLCAGHGLYWNLHGDTIWLIGYERLAKALVNLALTTMTRRKHNPKTLRNLVATNTPGMIRGMYIDVASNNLEQFESACYAAWHHAKDGNPLSRYVLTRLWNRDTKTLIRWQKLAGITVFNTFVHYTAEYSHFVPHNPEGGYRGGVIEYKVGKEKRWSAEYSNTYRTGAIRQHPVRGQSFRVFKVVCDLIETEASTSIIGQGNDVPGGLIRRGRLVYADSKRARGSYRKYPDVEERLIDKGFDSRRSRHLEFSPDGRERMRLETCARAGKVLDNQ